MSTAKRIIIGLATVATLAAGASTANADDTVGAVPTDPTAASKVRVNYDQLQQLTDDSSAVGDLASVRIRGGYGR